MWGIWILQNISSLYLVGFHTRHDDLMIMSMSCDKERVQMDDESGNKRLRQQRLKQRLHQKHDQEERSKEDMKYHNPFHTIWSLRLPWHSLLHSKLR